LKKPKFLVELFKTHDTVTPTPLPALPRWERGQNPLPPGEGKGGGKAVETQ